MDIDFANLLDMAADASGTLSNAVSTFAQITKLAEANKLPVDEAGSLLALSTCLGQAEVKLARLETEIVKLQRAQEAVDRVEQRKRNYVLSETPMGERVYRLKEGANTGELPHDLCPNCFERDQFCILQPRGSILQCDSCKTNYRNKESAVRSTVVRTRRGSLDGVY